MSHSKFANNRMDANGKKSSSSFVSSRKSVKETKVAVVGGGLVGSMMACFLAKRGYKVSSLFSKSYYGFWKILQGRIV